MRIADAWRQRGIIAAVGPARDVDGLLDEVSLERQLRESRIVARLPEGACGALETLSDYIGSEYRIRQFHVLPLGGHPLVTEAFAEHVVALMTWQDAKVLRGRLTKRGLLGEEAAAGVVESYGETPWINVSLISACLQLLHALPDYYRGNHEAALLLTSGTH